MTGASGWQGVEVSHVGRREDGAPAWGHDAPGDEPLAALLVRKWKLGVQQASDILIPVISELAAAHAVGIVHGDLSPRNIMLSQQNGELVPRVLGFGSSRSPEECVQRTGLLPPLGVRMYLSPEQANGAREVDPRSDQFALGLVLYECLTGQPPFEAGSVDAVTAQVVSSHYRKPRELEPTIPRTVEALIARTLRKRPEDRCPSMRDLGAALLPFASPHVQRSYVAEFGPSVRSPHSGSRPRARAEGRVDADRRDGVSRSEVASQKRRPARGPVLGALAAALIVLLLLVLAARRNDETSAPAESPTPAQAAAEPAPLAADAVPKPSARPEGGAPRTDLVGAAPASRAATSTYQIDLTVEPSTAWIMLDLKAAGSGRLRRTLPRDGRTHELRVGAPGYKPRTLRFKDAPPPKSLMLKKRTQPSAAPRSR